jgi:ribose 5-phosphate isomerase B
MSRASFHDHGLLTGGTAASVDNPPKWNLMGPVPSFGINPRESLTGSERAGGTLTDMRVHLGCDHAGFELKNVLVDHLRQAGHEVVDHGAHEFDALDDYPAFCFAAAEAVAAEPGSLGIVLGGSGNGEQIAANKVRGVRAALAWNPEIARLARQHNNANVIGLGARQHSEQDALAIADAFVAEPFSEDARHQRRIDQLSSYETSGQSDT